VLASIGVLGFQDVGQKNIGQSAGFLPALPFPGNIGDQDATGKKTGTYPQGRRHASTLPNPYQKVKHYIKRLPIALKTHTAADPAKTSTSADSTSDANRHWGPAIGT